MLWSTRLLLFSPTEGAGFSLTRTHINSSDYANNHYTYVEENDEDLSTFSIQEDLKGFYTQYKDSYFNRSQTVKFLKDIQWKNLM